MNVSGVIHWVIPSVCMPSEDLGVHELTYLGDDISVMFDTNGHQRCLSLKISLTVLYSHLASSKETIGGSLGGPVSDLQRCVGDLFLKS